MVNSEPNLAMSKSNNKYKVPENLPKTEIGQKYGTLTLISEFPGKRLNPRKFLCRCECGKEAFFYVNHLRNSHTKSCGCKTGEIISSKNTRHGFAKGKIRRSIYGIWHGILDRCLNRKRLEFKNYGGRGILVCKRWLRFENFLADMGDNNGLTIDRINNDGHYNKSNCRWATMKEQLRNTRRTVLNPEMISQAKKWREGGKTFVEIAKLLGVKETTIRNPFYPSLKHRKWQ